MYYQFSNDNRLPSLIFKNQPEYLRKENLDRKNIELEKQKKYDCKNLFKKSIENNISSNSMLIPIEYKKNFFKAFFSFLTKFFKNRSK